MSAAKTVEVLRTKTPAPQPPVAPERSTSVRYKVTFTSASAKFNVVSLLENGREVDSHTISGSGDSQEWSRTFVADRRDAPGTYHYEVQSCNGSGCAVSKAITVVVTGGYDNNCSLPGHTPGIAPAPEQGAITQDELAELINAVSALSLERKSLIEAGELDINSDELVPDFGEPIDCIQQPVIEPLPIDAPGIDFGDGALIDLEEALRKKKRRR